ncbi:MAG: hypothetical protein RIF33_16260 [Cyclobacteriaceae bacterium]
MTEWYIPITILPGVGLLIMSTSALVANLSNETGALIKENCQLNKLLIQNKIEQLTRLNRAMVGLYFSSGALVLSGILKAVLSTNYVSEALLFLGALLLFVGLFFLMRYSVLAVKIRKQQFLDQLAQ